MWRGLAYSLSFSYCPINALMYKWVMLITLRIGEGLSVKLQLSYRQQFQLAFSYIMLNIWTPLPKYFLLIEYQLNQYLQMCKLTLYSWVVCRIIKRKCLLSLDSYVGRSFKKRKRKKRNMNNIFRFTCIKWHFFCFMSFFLDVFVH